jgi:hypothetical protein
LLSLGTILHCYWSNPKSNFVRRKHKNLAKPFTKKNLLNSSQIICDSLGKFVSLGEPLGTVDRNLQIWTKITNVKSFHINTFLHHLTVSSQFYFVVPFSHQQKQRGRCSGTGERVTCQDPSKRGQWTLVMPPPGGCAVHLSTPAMAVRSREGATKMVVQERASWRM